MTQIITSVIVEMMTIERRKIQWLAMTRCMLGVLLGVLPLVASGQSAADVVDITSRFQRCWGSDERVTANADGSLTFKSGTWGGLSLWLGGEDWSDYSQLAFELASPSPCVVQPIIQYANDQWDRHYMTEGTTTAYIELDAGKRSHVEQVALQTDRPATLIVRRIYLRRAVAAGGAGQPGQLMINELMQSNIDCVMDDLNDFPDSWVELYNSGSTAINLSHYKIGITPDAADAWQLPSQTVAAGGMVVVWCDKVGQRLHTPFRLDSGKGAAVYLFLDGAPDAQVTDLKKQPAPNIAYGRLTEGSTEWGYQQTATPGQPNCRALCTALLPDPVFSQKGMVTTSGQTFRLTLSMPDGVPSGTQIRYTTNGSEPQANSALYTTPITIGNTLTVRAKLFFQGYMSPRSTTHSYLFLDHATSLPVVSLVTDQRYWTDSSIGILPNNTDSRRVNWRRPVNIEYFEHTGEPSQLNQLCETRVQGGATRAAALKSLAVYANKRFGTKRLTYEFFPDQRPGVTDFKSVLLRNAGNDFDYLYLRDAVIQRTMSRYADLDWQAWRPAVVFKNGVYKGILNIRERANEDNVYTNYGGLEDIDLIENWNDLKEGDWTNYNRFKEFYSQTGHTLAEYEQWMDCTEFGNLMLLNLYFNNQDFPGNNIVMWRPRTADGRWRFVAKDTDFGLGLYGSQPSYRNLEWLYQPNYDNDRNWGANSESATRLYRRLMDNADFRRQFLDRAAVYMGDFLNERGCREVWDPMYDMIKDEYPHHRALYNAWWPNYNTELTNARQWLARRTDLFYQQLADYYGLGTPTVLTVNKGLDDRQLSGMTVSINGIALSRGTMDGKFFAGRRVTLTAQGGTAGSVTGWQVVRTDADGQQTVTTVNSPTYDFDMPQCRSLALTALMGTDGISIAAADQDRWTWRATDNVLTVSLLPAGTAVSLFDLRGVLLHRSTAAQDGKATVPVVRGTVYLLRVGQTTTKIRP